MGKYTGTYHGKPCKHCGGTLRRKGNSNCVPCGNTSRAESMKRNNGGLSYSRGSHLLRKFGLTEAAYFSMLDGQGGVCAICKGQQTDSRRRFFSVDHDHLTGEIRGLLCGKCNTGLGQFRDNPKLLEAAIRYITSRY